MNKLSVNELVNNIATLVDKKGGKTYYVGGYVRDKFLGIISKDLDIEVHGIYPKDLEEILKKFGSVITIGESFGIYSIKGYDIDIAMPRKESQIGLGHKDFDVIVDPFLGEEKSSVRRDFTINALMQNVLTGEVIDFYGGLNDLKNHIIHHVNSDTFIEDPLRVLRACQFSARFDFEIAKDTISLCKQIDLSYLSKERIEAELKKALLKSKHPSIFFDSLRKMNQLSYWFKEVEDLIDLKQDPIYHPEGDTYIHTMMVLDKGTMYLDKVKEKYPFMLSLLCHDFGKVDTSEEINGRIHAYKHEISGEKIANKFLSRLTCEKKTIKYVCNMVLNHMKTHALYKDKSSIKATNKMFDSSICPIDLIYVSLSDNVNKTDEELNDIYNFLKERLDIYNEYMNKPCVMGIDLENNGIKPSKEYKILLDYAHKLHLSGVNKEIALKQTLAYYKEIMKNQQ